MIADFLEDLLSRERIFKMAGTIRHAVTAVLLVMAICGRFRQHDDVQDASPIRQEFTGVGFSDEDLRNFLNYWGKELALSSLVITLPHDVTRPHRHRPPGMPGRPRNVTCQQTWRHPVSMTKFMGILLLISGDISANPGPIKFPCVECDRPVAKNQRGIMCDNCDMWSHAKCINMSNEDYDRLSSTDVNAPEEHWFCSQCLPTADAITSLPDDDGHDSVSDTECDTANTRQITPIKDSRQQPDNRPKRSDSEQTGCGTALEGSMFQDLKLLRSKCAKSPILAYLNINSLKYKYIDLSQIFQYRLLDIFAISETKLDSSFPTAQFSNPGYNVFRKDKTKNSGGLMIHVRSEIPARRRPDLESTSVETIVLETIFDSKKWACVIAYRSPSITDNVFIEEMHSTLDSIIANYDNVVIMGDLNYDLLRNTSKNPAPLIDIMDAFNMVNLVKDPTCFMVSPPSQIDVILTNRPRSFQYTCTITDAISDHHAMIVTTMKSHITFHTSRSMKRRSYKSFNKQMFIDDVKASDPNSCEAVSDVKASWKLFSDKLKTIIDHHAPIKEYRVRTNQPPFINKHLKQAIWLRKRLYKKISQVQNW